MSTIKQPLLLLKGSLQHLLIQIRRRQPQQKNKYSKWLLSATLWWAWCTTWWAMTICLGWWGSRIALQDRAGWTQCQDNKIISISDKSNTLKTKVNFLGMCFDWKVLVGQVAVGIAIAVLVPQLTLRALPLLLLAACPLAILLMMNQMDKDSISASSHRRSLLPASKLLNRDEQLAQLRV